MKDYEVAALVVVVTFSLWLIGQIVEYLVTI
jgi:hypothetical protein